MIIYGIILHYNMHEKILSFYVEQIHQYYQLLYFQNFQLKLDIHLNNYYIMFLEIIILIY